MGEQKSNSEIMKVALVAILGPFMTSLDATVVNISMPSLSKEFSASVSEIQWVISAYLLALALTLPVSGWLVDRFGPKKMYLWCFVAFTLASVLCGMAQTSALLIFFRVLQGMAGGLLAPMAQMMMARAAGNRLAKVMGIAVMPVLLAPILGPAIAGLILQHASWRWLFYLNLPVGVIAIAIASWLLPRDTRSGESKVFDLKGFLLLSPGLAFFLYGLENAIGTGVYSILLGLGLLTSFYIHTNKSKNSSLIDLSLFKRKTFLAASVTQFLANGVTFSGQMLIPLYLINKCHLTASETGLLIVPLGIGMLVTYPSMGFLTTRFGCRRVSAGGALLALVATIPFIWMSHAGLVKWLLNVMLFFRGAGMGGINIPSIAAAYASIPARKLPVATTTINIAQRVGGPIATTLVAVFMDAGLKFNLPFGIDIFTGAFIFLCLLQFANVVSALFLPDTVEEETPEANFQALEALAD